MVKKTKTLKTQTRKHAKKATAKDETRKTAKKETLKSTKVDTVKIVEEEVKKLLGLMKVKVEIEVGEDKENEAIAVQLTTEEPGILIGYHGEGLAAFQLILSLIVNKKFDQWTRILVNVNDYRQKREESLKMVALNAAQKVKFSDEAVVLTNLSPAERRIVHLTLTDHPDVESVSEGQGNERRLVIKPKK
jgi:spoIIIJ-associated protein